MATKTKTAAAKSTAAKSTARKSAPKHAAKAEPRQIKHVDCRVWRLPRSLRQSLRAYREVEGVSVRRTYELAVLRAGAIADALIALQVRHDAEEVGAVRVKHGPELAELRRHADRCGLDMSALLAAGLRTLVAEATPAAPARRGRRRA